jgi:uncharacterized protein (DUF1778 family)
MPPKKKIETTNLNIRLPPAEKRAFKRAAEIAMRDLTTWVRLNLRKASGLDK